jgi:hypothetical protein
MIELRNATEDEMILAFLRAEVDSTRYGAKIAEGLAFVRQPQALIAAPNLADPTENLARRVVLAGYRGYDLGTGLFEGFPGDMVWRYVQLEARDFAVMRYINDIATPRRLWHKLTGGSRLVADGARNYTSGPPAGLSHIMDVLAAFRTGEMFQPLIAAEHTDGSLILIEGHSRATVYLMEGQTFAHAFVGSSPVMARWAFY